MKSFKTILSEVSKINYEHDDEMAINQLKTIARNAQALVDMLEKESTDLPEWLESKITLAEDYILTAYNYMKSEMDDYNP